MSASCTEQRNSEFDRNHLYQSPTPTNYESSSNMKELYYKIERKTNNKKFLMEIYHEDYKPSTSYVIEDKKNHVLIYLQKVIQTLKQFAQNEMVNNFLLQIKTNDLDSLTNTLRELKNSHDYKKIQNISDNLDKAFLIEKLSIELPLKKIEIEELQQDLFKVKSLTSKLIKKEDYGLKQQLENKIQDIIEKFESRSIFIQVLNKLEMNEEDIEKKIHIRH